ncbi:MAG: hypothetical protein PVJ47_06145 [Thiohalocapsa sp.]|jgi:hypothetical protein
MQHPHPNAAADDAGCRIDTLRRLETPEDVEIALRLARPVPRALAFVAEGLRRYQGVG